MERIDLTIGNDMANKIMGVYDIDWDKFIANCDSHTFIDIKKVVEEKYPYLHLDDSALVKMIEEAGWGVEIGIGDAPLSMAMKVVKD